MIRILLVDDHAASREPLAMLLDRDPDLVVVAQAGSLAEAREALAGVEIDVAVVDLSLPDGSGVELIRELRARNPDAAVMVLTALSDRLERAQAIEAGAAGVVHKSAHIGEIITAIRRLAAGEQILPPGEALELFRLVGQQREQNRQVQRALAQLTPREREVLQALADGLSDKEIAVRLHISNRTVRTHMVHILGKLGVESRLQALVLALRHGVITLD